jgi:hypothetical protein
VVAGVIFVELGGPHLVLTHVGGDDGFAFGELVELVDDLLHAQAALLFVAERVFLFVAVEVREPVFGGQFFDERQEVAESGFGVAFDGDVHLIILLNSAASMSMWMSLALRPNMCGLPMMRSSKREPTLKMRSASQMALLA